jgi:hypothetical protein
MGPAPLPGCAGQNGADGVLQPLMGIGNDKGHPGKATRDECKR